MKLFNKDVIPEIDLQKEVTFESIVAAAIKIPGVKVNRNEFLGKTFANEGIDLQNIIDYGPIEAGCTEEQLEKLADKLILLRTSESSMVSFAAGIPGGLAMAATIPADTLQFFGMVLRIAQELAYLYGNDDFWRNGSVNGEMVQNQLVLYTGVMFDIEGASEGVRLLSADLAKQTLKKLPQKALSRTLWYPIVKQVGKAIAIKITKDTATKGISKAIPVIGGLVSGGITFAAMKPMGKRLAEILEEANFRYTPEKAKHDLEVIQALAKNFFDSEAPAENMTSNTEKVAWPDAAVDAPAAAAPAQEDVLATIEKLAKLRDMGAITEEEYQTKKTELLSRL